MRMYLVANKATVTPRRWNAEVVEVEIEAIGSLEDEITEACKKHFTKEMAVEEYGLIDPDEENVGDAIDRHGTEAIVQQLSVEDIIEHFDKDKLKKALAEAENEHS